MDFLHSHKQNPANAGSNEPGNEMSHGSKNLKHQRSGVSEDIWKLPKMPRVDEVDFNTMKKGGGEIFGRSDLWTSGADDGQKMLSFSSNSEPNRCSRNIAFSIYQDENNRVNGGGFNEAMMRSPFARLKGPFTPSQWMELEIQALIYKHFVANVPVPSNLLMPIKKSLYSYGPHTSYPSNFLGWGPFHLGYSGSNDPEPGRCRRTDGKKWRCSRDAVPDQKYCERHINRGRHRSRKPVEGQSGQAVPGSATTTNTNTNNKVEPIAPSSLSASVISSRGASSSLGAVQLEQYNSLQQQQQHNTGSAFIDHLGSRTQGFQGIPVTSKIDMKSTEVPFSIQKEHLPQYEDSSHSMFGLVTSDALVNPSERISYMTNSRDSDSFIGFNEKETSDQHPVHHFMDDWPKDHHSHQSDHPKELKSHWTQLSMSIPDFSSSSTSPVQEKSSEVIPTLSLSHEWGSSMGGPLGEVLTSTTSTPHGLSPTGVLQKSTLFTLSNSSSGSRDDFDNNAPDNANLFNVLGSTRVSSTVDSSY